MTPTDVQISGLAARALDLMGQAIRWRGTSFFNYRDADDKRGSFQEHMLLYDRQDDPCRVCASAIKRVAIEYRNAKYRT